MGVIGLRRRHLTLSALCLGLVALALATAPVAAAGGLTVVRSVDTNKKVIALTFDDGWSPSRTREIVAILDYYGATATFFPYANAVAASPATWRAVAQRFPLGNHTTTHPNLTRLSPSQIFWEIDNARRVIEGITGQRMLPFFRPPYMDYDATVEAEAYSAGFNYMMLWSVDSGDSVGLGDARVYAHAIKAQPGGIVLFHAGPPVTVRVLPRVLAYYKARGYSFVTLPEMLGLPWKPAVTGGGGSGGGGYTCDCPDPAQLIGGGPAYLRPSAAFRAVPD
jgi:peptidoglycan/xylan/chitin deacetylase (PgdA/CDA1 family)